MTRLFVTTVAETASLLQTWLDEGQRRAWVLAEAARV